MATPCTHDPNEVIEKVVSAKTNADKFDRFVNGTDTQTVQLGNGSPTPTIRNVVRQVMADASWAKQFIADAPEGDVSLNNATAMGGIASRTLAERFSDIVHVEDYGAKGDATTDDTDSIQAALAAASGKILLFDNKTYIVSESLTANDVFIAGNGCSIKTSSDEASPAFIAGSGTSLSNVTFITPSGDVTYTVVRIDGSNVSLDNCHFTALGETSDPNKEKQCIEIVAQNNPKNVSIKNCSSVNCSTFLLVRKCDNLVVENVDINKFRLAVFLRDTTNSVFSNIHCYGLGANVNGRNGENGILLESYSGENSVQNVKFYECKVEDSGEHAYRLGGNYTIRDVSFTNCIAIRSGSAILNQHETATTWFGGCGFKVLGGGALLSNGLHKNIHFTNCTVYDCNDTDGSFPSGHGIANFSGFFVGCADGVYLTSCSVKKLNQEKATSRYGILLEHSNNIFIDDCEVNDCQECVALYTENAQEGHEGLSLGLNNIFIRNCVLTPNTYIGNGFTVAATRLSYTNWNFSNIVVKNSGSFMYVCALDSGGSFANVSVSGSFTPHQDSMESTTPPVFGPGANNFLAYIESPKRASELSSINCKVGSLFNDTTNNQLKYKHNEGWRRIPVLPIDYDWYPDTDNMYRLGHGDARWKLLYLANGTIQTSDEREKQQIADVSDKVMMAWSKVGFSEFKFNEAVESKGEGARIHVGVIAQRVKDAFESEGLDASRYGLFCYDEWNDEYESYEVVDSEAVYDQNGVEVQPRRAHMEQRLVRRAGNRYGIRYEEALALECAYQRWLGEQRDARIAALEARLNEFSGNSPAPSGASPDNL